MKLTSDKAGKTHSMPRLNIYGLIFSLLFCSCLLWCGFQLTMITEIVSRPTPNSEERLGRTYENLQTISTAQHQYYDKSAAILGQSQYAQFLAHLWITPDHQGNQIQLDLIPRRLALAMGRKKTLNGYYFKDVHFRIDGNRMKRIDYSRHWAIAALPIHYRKNGTEVFLADDSGRIYLKKFTKTPDGYPLNPSENGWKDRTAIIAP